MSKLLISTTTGNETQADSSCKAYVYYCPPDNGKEVILPRACKKFDFIEKQGSGPRVQAIQGVRAEIGGQWTTQNYSMEEGKILKITATRKAGWNALIESAQMYIKLRAGAAHRRIEIDTIGNRKSTLDKIKIQGRFDILTMDEVFAEANIEVPQPFRKFHAPTNRNRLFREIILDKEKAPRHKIEVSKMEGKDGKEVVIRRRTRTRRLKVK